jgi:tetratricopeptide (TPR) repeat protein
METDLAGAERLLREALAADLFFGPAHNNLGVLFLKQGKRYEAANEFEWAKKLMPAHPDPRVNLAMTLEEAGRVDDAIASYTAALEVYPGYLPAVQGIARVSVRAGREDDRLRGWLDSIVLQSREDAWREWARREASELELSPPR